MNDKMSPIKCLGYESVIVLAKKELSQRLLLQKEKISRPVFQKLFLAHAPVYTSVSKNSSKYRYTYVEKHLERERLIQI